MAIRLEYYSNVIDGKIQNNVRQQIAKELKHFNGKRVVIRIQKMQSERSIQQNRYIHALFTIFKDNLNELGNEFSMEEVKEMCKFKFALIEVSNEETGEVIGKRIKGTHEMSRVEMMAFIEKIITYAAETFHIILPYPNEEMQLNFGK